ncbi:hypothetical protein ACWCPX_33080 [Streptomyces olivaceoviridis]
MEFFELVDQILLGLTRVILGHRPPGNEQCIRVGQLPDVASAPVAGQQTGAVASVVGKPLIQSVLAAALPMHTIVAPSTQAARSLSAVTDGSRPLRCPAGLVGRNDGGEVSVRITT